MKLLLGLIFVMSFASATTATSKSCKDKNLNEVTEKIDYYYELKTLEAFTQLGQFDSAAPAGMGDVFENNGETCREVKATYLKHIDGTQYVLYTTHEDYCDGGNTIGVMVNMSLYQSVFSFNQHGAVSIEDSIVAYIGDSEIECVDDKPAAPLTLKETKKIEDYLNDICGDTFCGGDIDYNISNFVCTSDSCTLDVYGSYYFDEDDRGSFKNVCDLAPIANKLRKADSYDKKEDMVYDYVVFGSCLDQN